MHLTKNVLEIIHAAKYPVFYTGSRMLPAEKINNSNEFICGERLIDILSVDNLRNFDAKIPRVFSELIKRMSILSPSKDHLIMKELGLPIITENIDGLHKVVGSLAVIELHGNLRTQICTNCDYKFSINKYQDQTIFSNCPVCHVGKIRPNVVLKGEPLRDYHLAFEELQKTDLLIVLGHDPENWPACRLIVQAKNNRSCRTIEF